MNAALLTGIRQMEIRDVPEPRLEAADSVLLRVDVVGLCGSDLHYFRTGRIGDQVVHFPWRIGHEFAATVLEVGSAVDSVAVGDRVAVDPLVVCGRCDQCRSGWPHTCRNQVFMGCPGQLEGCLTERVVLPASCCFTIPERMTAEQAALVEPFSICLHAQRLAGQSDGAAIAILGAGPMGLGVLAAVRAAWRATTYVTDLLEERLAVARRLGADRSVNALEENVPAALLAEHPGGLDCVFECAGQQETLDQAAELLGPRGTMVIVGIPETDRIVLPMDAIRRKELRIQNVRRQNHCMEPAIRMLAGGGQLETLVTHRFPLARTQEAFDLAAGYRDGAIKVMVYPNEAQSDDPQAARTGADA